MRKAIFAALWFAAVVFCVPSEKPGTIKDLIWGDRIEDLALVINSDKQDYKIGDEILVRIIIKNFSNKRAETAYLGGINEKIRLEMFDNDGRPAQKTDQWRNDYKRAFAKPEMGVVSTAVAVLDSAGELQSSIKLNRYFKIESPGTYYLIAMRGQWNWDQAFLVSNMAHFRVVKE
jgi:hypothetical protein